MSLESEESMPAIPGAFDALTKSAKRALTPEQPSPARNRPVAGITQAQKQALIDNLQLEITEQARKMRANYAEQAQALQSQLERRINRVPTAMRKRKLGELLDERSAWERAERERRERGGASEDTNGRARRSLKRGSDQFSSAEDEDKENDWPEPPSPSPKKRAKTSTSTVNTIVTANPPPMPSLPTNHLGLSTKSHNANTSKIPRSPPKPTNTNTNTFPRPASPGKPLPMPPTLSTKPSSTVLNRTASRLALPTKKTAQQLQAELAAAKTSRPSDGSNTSSGTTLVRKNTANASTTTLNSTTGTTKSKSAGVGVGVSAGFKRITTAAASSVKTAVAGVGGKKNVTAANGGNVGTVPAAAKKENVAPSSTSAGRPVGRNLRKRT